MIVRVTEDDILAVSGPAYDAALEYYGKEFATKVGVLTLTLLRVARAHEAYVDQGDDEDDPAIALELVDAIKASRAAHRKVLA